MTRALLDAEFHDTPIGRCVVLSYEQRYNWIATRPLRVEICHGETLEEGVTRSAKDNHFDAGDVLAVVVACPTCEGTNKVRFPAGDEWPDREVVGGCTGCDTGYVRRGFVRVVEVLPVVDGHGSDWAAPGGPDHVYVVWDVPPQRLLMKRRTAEDGTRWWRRHPDDITLPASPGDVVLVVEAWCETCGGKRKVHEWIEVEEGSFQKATDPCPDCASTPVRRVDGGSGPGVGEVEW